MDIKAINKRISELCAARNWTLYKLSKEAGFQQSTLKAIRKEKNMPTLYTISRICSAFGISLSEFFRSELFGYNTKADETYIELWDLLSDRDREKVQIYMYGLLHIDIPKEGIE